MTGPQCTVGSKYMKLTRRVLGHLLICSLVRLHCSLSNLLRTACFARALRCAHSLAHSPLYKRVCQFIHPCVCPSVHHAFSNIVWSKSKHFEIERAKSKISIFVTAKAKEKRILYLWCHWHSLIVFLWRKKCERQSKLCCNEEIDQKTLQPHLDKK